MCKNSSQKSFVKENFVEKDINSSLNAFEKDSRVIMCKKNENSDTEQIWSPTNVDVNTNADVDTNKKIDKCLAYYDEVITDIVIELQVEFKNQQSEEQTQVAWIFKEPDKFNTLKYGKLVQNTGMNLLGVVNVLQEAFRKGLTWREVIIDAWKKNDLDLMIYVAAVKRFLKQCNYKYLFAYLTEMISTKKVIDFNQSILCIDLSTIKYLLDTTQAGLWQIIKDNKYLYSQYENLHHKQINIWNLLLRDRRTILRNQLKKLNKFPYVYYKFIDIDNYNNSQQVQTNLFI